MHIMVIYLNANKNYKKINCMSKSQNFLTENDFCRYFSPCHHPTGYNVILY